MPSLYDIDETASKLVESGYFSKDLDADEFERRVGYLVARPQDFDLPARQ